MQAAGAGHEHTFLAGGGEMGRRIRATDWAATPLGQPQEWPTPLKVVLRTALTSRQPVFVFWGPEHRCFYNDAYRASLGPEKHPAILGAPGRQAWPETWHVIGPQIGQVMAGGEATWHENHLVPIERHGTVQDVFWTYSFGPIHDEDAPGGIGGVLVLCRETTAEVLADRRARESEARLAQFFEQAPTFMALLEGPEHRIVRCNPGYLQLVGHRPVIGHTVAEALPEAAGQGYLDLLDGVFRSGKPYLGREQRYVGSLASGEETERVLTFAYQPLRDGAGQVTGIFVEGTDVTDAVRTREALRASEEKFRELFNSLDAGFCIVETRGGTDGVPPDYRVIEANPAFARHTGLVGFEGRWLREAIPGMEEHWFETYCRVSLTGEPARFVNHAAELGDRWFEVNAFRTGAAEARLVGILFSDITPRLRAERALSEGEARWRTAFQAMHEGFSLCEMVHAPDGRPVDFRFVEVNAAWERQTSVTREQAVGRLGTEVFPDLDRSTVETYARVVETGEPAQFESHLPGLERSFEVIAYRTEPRRFGALFLDVTERKAAERRQALLSQEVDHRAKNALAVVQAAVRLTRAPDMPAFVRAIEGRISALARAQTLLSQDRWAGADLHALLRGELHAFLGADGPVALLEGPAVALPAGAAQPLAMAVHELATNAVKYGALSMRAGRLVVSWSVASPAPGLLHLLWVESGGPTVAARPARNGFGTRVLEATVRSQLGGKIGLEWHRSGLRCRMTLPLGQWEPRTDRQAAAS